MTYLYSFLFCGALCLTAEIIFDNTKLTAGHITSLFVVVGTLLDVFNIYDKIVLKVGGGALVPITSFGHLLIHGALEMSKNEGVMGIAMGVFNLTSSGITFAIVFSFIFALIFKPKN